MKGDMEKKMTTQRQIRRRFWETFPELPKKRIKDHSGHGTMPVADVRIAFVDFVDALQKSGEISPELAQRATL